MKMSVAFADQIWEALDEMDKASQAWGQSTASKSPNESTFAHYRQKREMLCERITALLNENRRLAAECSQAARKLEYYRPRDTS